MHLAPYLLIVMSVEAKNKPIVRSRAAITEKKLDKKVQAIAIKTTDKKKEAVKNVSAARNVPRITKEAPSVHKENLRYKRIISSLKNSKKEPTVEKKDKRPIVKLPTKNVAINKPTVKKQVKLPVEKPKKNKMELKKSQTYNMLASLKFGKNAHRAVISDRDSASIITPKLNEKLRKSILSDYRISSQNKSTSDAPAKTEPVANEVKPVVKEIKPVTKQADVMPKGDKSLIDYICEPDGKTYTSDTSGIIVTMTSWPKRIKNVEKTLTTILNNTTLPEKIIVNLSTAEFPGKESNLPNGLVLLAQKNPIIEFHWLKHNTTVWKKIIPTIIRFKNANVICIDDDRLYPKNFIATFNEAASKYPSGPITGANISFHKKFKQHCGHATLDKYTFYRDGLDFITKEVMDLKSSDSVLTIIANRTGHPTQYLGTNYLSLIPQNNNPVDGYSSNGKVSVSAAIKSADTLFDRYLSSQKKEGEKIDVKIYTESYGDFEITYAEIL